MKTICRFQWIKWRERDCSQYLFWILEHTVVFKNPISVNFPHSAGFLIIFISCSLNNPQKTMLEDMAIQDEIKRQKNMQYQQEEVGDKILAAWRLPIAILSTLTWTQAQLTIIDCWIGIIRLDCKCSCQNCVITMTKHSCDMHSIRWTIQLGTHCVLLRTLSYRDRLDISSSQTLSESLTHCKCVWGCGECSDVITRIIS